MNSFHFISMNEPYVLNEMRTPLWEFSVVRFTDWRLCAFVLPALKCWAIIIRPLTRT